MVKTSISQPKVLFGHRLSVSLLPSRFIENITGETEESKLIFNYLSQTCTTDLLKEYLQKKSKCPVRNVQYSLHPGVALVTFDGIPGKF